MIFKYVKEQFVFMKILKGDENIEVNRRFIQLELPDNEEIVPTSKILHIDYKKADINRRIRKFILK